MTFDHSDHFEAKTNLSELGKKAQVGETVIITSGRDKKPVAKLEAIHPTPKQRIGGLEDPNFVLTDAFWEDLTGRRVGTLGR